MQRGLAARRYRDSIMLHVTLNIDTGPFVNGNTRLR
jgi:hypothetical protein